MQLPGKLISALVGAKSAVARKAEAVAPKQSRSVRTKTNKCPGHNSKHHWFAPLENKIPNRKSGRFLTGFASRCIGIAFDKHHSTSPKAGYYAGKSISPLRPKSIHSNNLIYTKLTILPSRENADLEAFFFKF